MNDSIFRQKSIDKISSPEQLNDYVRVSSPGVWLILSAIILLLAGICFYGIFGRLETKLEVAGVCKNGVLTCYIKENDVSKIESGMAAVVNEEKYEINAVSPAPETIDTEIGTYAMHIGNLQEGEWVYEATADAQLQDGIYTVSIVVDSVSPMSFIWN